MTCNSPIAALWKCFRIFRQQNVFQALAGYLSYIIVIEYYSLTQWQLRSTIQVLWLGHGSWEGMWKPYVRGSLLDALHLRSRRPSNVKQADILVCSALIVAYVAIELRCVMSPLRVRFARYESTRGNCCDAIILNYFACLSLFKLYNIVLFYFYDVLDGFKGFFSHWNRSHVVCAVLCGNT